MPAVLVNCEWLIGVAVNVAETGVVEQAGRTDPAAKWNAERANGIENTDHLDGHAGRVCEKPIFDACPRVDPRRIKRAAAAPLPARELPLFPLELIDRPHFATLPVTRVDFLQRKRRAWLKQAATRNQAGERSRGECAATE